MNQIFKVKNQQTPKLEIVSPENTSATWEKGALHLKIRNVGNLAQLRLLPGESGMKLPDAAFLVVDVKNLSEQYQMRLHMRLELEGYPENGEKGLNLLRTGIVLNPQEEGEMRLCLSPHAQVPVKQRREWIAINPGDYAVKAVTFWIADLSIESCPYPVECHLSNIRLEGKASIPDGSKGWKTPVVDKFGQFIHSDWSEKVTDEEVLPEDLRLEREYLQPPPAQWNRYGGWASGPKLEATGHFRTAKHNGRWWFVDPDGSLFFSYGIDVLRHSTDVSNGKRNRFWYDMEIPKNGWMSFTHWSLQKKFSNNDYLSDYYEFILDRLDSWGVNTIGRWGARKLTMYGRKPYLIYLFDSARGVPEINGANMYDCFHPDFESGMLNAVNAEKREESVLHSLDDPMCMGYVVDNEKDFDGMFDAMLAQSVPYSHAKEAFFEDLRQKHRSIDELNKVWKTNFRDWNEAEKICSAIPSHGFVNDALEFKEKWLNLYFSVCRKAVKSLSPDKLYFSGSFNGLRQSAVIWEAAARHADVLSANIHTYSVANFRPWTSTNAPERPLLISAFNFGCADRGMFSGGVCPVGTQKERARSLKRFINGALDNPRIAGCHWFQYRDQPLTGRYDGECYQIGFVDVCDRPYTELIEASRNIGSSLYG